MNWIQLDDFALLLLRVSLAYIFLLPALAIVSDRNRWLRTVQRTAILFRDTSLSDNEVIVRLAAGCGVAMMAIGGMGVLLGIFEKSACIILIVFTAPGILIHNRELKQSIRLVEKISMNRTEPDTALLKEVKASLIEGHRSTAKKNVALIGVALFILLFSNPVGNISLAAFLW